MADLDETLESILSGKPPKEGPRQPDDQPKPEGGGTADDKEMDDALSRILAGEPSTTGPSAPKKPEVSKPTTMQQVLHGPVTGAANLIAAPGGMMQAIGHGLERPKDEEMRGHVPDWLLDATAPIRRVGDVLSGGLRWAGDVLGPERLLAPLRGSVIPEDPNWEPDTAGGRFANLLTQNLTAAGLAGLPAAAGRGALTTAPAASASLAASTPTAPTAGALIAPAVGAAGLQHAAHELAPGQPMLEMGAGILGGHGGVGMANLGAKAVAPLGGTLSPLKQVRDAARVRDALSQVMTKMATEMGATPEGLLDTLYRRQTTPVESIPGFSPTTGRLLNDPTLLAIEKGLEGRVAAPGVVAEFEKRRRTMPGPRADNNQQAIRDFAEAGVDASANPNLPRQVAEDVSGRLTAAADAEAARLRQEAVTEQSAAGAQADATAAGLPGAEGALRRQADTARTIRTNLEWELEQRQAAAGDLYKQVQADDIGIAPFELRKAFDAVRKTAFENNRMDAMPKIMRPLEDQSGNPIGRFVDDHFQRWQMPNEDGQWMPNLTYKQATGLRSRLAESLREASSETEKGYINTLINGLDKSLKASLPRDKYAQYKMANAFFRREVAVPFYDRSARANKVLKPGFDESTTGDIFFEPGVRGADAAAAINKALGYDKAKTLMRDYAVDDMLASTVGTDGRIDPRRFNEWQKRHSPALQFWPEAQRELADRGLMARAAQERLEAAKRLSRENEVLATGTTMRAQNAVKQSAAGLFLGADPSHAVGNILKSADPVASARDATSFLRAHGGSDAVEGLGRAYYDSVIRRASDPNAEGGMVRNLHRIMRDEAGTMGELLPPDAIKRLRTVADAMAMEGRTAPANYTFLHALLDAHKVQPTGASAAGAMAMGAGAIAGRVVGGPGPGTIAGAALGRGSFNLFSKLREMRGQRGADLREAILREIVFDHNAYRDALRAYTPQNRTPYIERRVVAPFLLGTSAAIANKTLHQAPRDEAGDSNSITGLPVIDVDRPSAGSP